jgi:hypothetical protein
VSRRDPSAYVDQTGENPSVNSEPSITGGLTEEAVSS